MLKFGRIDESTHFHDQQKEKAGPVTVINTFVAPEGKEDEVVAAWTDDAEYMKKSGSLLSVQLYRGIGGSRLFTNVAVWKSPSTSVQRSAHRSSPRTWSATLPAPSPTRTCTRSSPSKASAKGNDDCSPIPACPSPRTRRVAKCDPWAADDSRR
ncbi:antibiotic biosynthesis monooxygenase [Streptomyces sp. NBC_01795]|uniref:antibiotic biosynthesis monooxygenase family protein n=1 Tax=Streptomyces sp. NBC_01795 TaxID=2975943 RepID=UPI002DD9A588|nr:antibiotic biosynthesis monooxygenase family protein [Streptomyces sp. NBC_01795]WSA90556.1 antibiotic biosynthesis monooxygenase [Streptomyces sp. NBC_01795]